MDFIDKNIDYQKALNHSNITAVGHPFSHSRKYC